MIDIDDLDNMSRTELVEHVEAYNESLLLVDRNYTELKRLRAELNQTRECLWWCYDLKRFGHKIEDKSWDFIGRLLGADTDHNDNEWEGKE